MGNRQYGIDPDRLSEYAQDIKTITDLGVEVAIVIGGGNIFRGVAGASKGMDRVQGDYMGMRATVINGLALQSALENAKVPTRLQTAIKINEVAEPFIRRRAMRHLEKGRVVIFGGVSQTTTMIVLYVCTVILAINGSLFDPTISSLQIEVVDPEYLQTANASLSMIRSIQMIVGLSLGGVLYDNGEKPERLVFVSPNPVQVTNSRYLAVGVTGFEEIAAAVTNPYAIARFDRS